MRPSRCAPAEAEMDGLGSFYLSSYQLAPPFERERGGWAYFGLSFGGFGAPTIATTVPTFSAVTSRKFGGSCSGIISATLSL